MKKVQLYFIVLFVAMASCKDKVDSPEIQQALVVQEEFMQLAGMVEDRIENELDEQKAALTVALEEGDSLAQAKMQVAVSLYENQKEAYQQWKSGVVEIPGHHHHEPGEPCQHDHSQDQILEKMSDGEILEIQKELKAKLDEIANTIGVDSAE